MGQPCRCRRRSDTPIKRHSVSIARSQLAGNRQREPFQQREKAWQRLANDLPLEKLDTMIHMANLIEVPAWGAKY